ncbi:MAG TPA: N-acetylglucosamine-6-phosphate deacetylase [Streptosporangiaceae bacterium]|nr:N-acetylglucosamine-6-phosphate deacetylase [Streptosporangiaceae bacterium]
MAELLIAAQNIVTATPDAAALATDATVLSPGYVLVEDGRITAVEPGDPPRTPDEYLDRGALVPGFVDIQVNGYYGVEFDVADETGWRLVADRLPETGTTAFMPTIITAPLPTLNNSLKAAASIIPALSGRPGGPGDGGPGRPASPGNPADPKSPGARVLGVHVEGPFISPKRGGAHNRDWMTDPTPEAVSGLLNAAQGHLKILTLAPERPQAIQAIRELTKQNVLVSVGHSDALARQVAEAADAGARMVTHLFNGQRPLHHREPGVVGQALADHRLTSGLVADFVHVAAPVCVIAFAAAPGRIVLVTDAAACAGMPPGQYTLGGQPIELPPGDGVPPIRPDGTLAGSALRMDVAVSNMVSVGVSLPEAVAAATRIPADLIGRPDLGRIAAGARADLTWLGEGLRAQATWIAGHRAY